MDGHRATIKASIEHKTHEAETARFWPDRNEFNLSNHIIHKQKLPYPHAGRISNWLFVKLYKLFYRYSGLIFTSFVVMISKSLTVVIVATRSFTALAAW